MLSTFFFQKYVVLDKQFFFLTIQNLPGTLSFKESGGMTSAVHQPGKTTAITRPSLGIMGSP